MTDQDKLRIPDPEEETDDGPDAAGNLVLAGALTLLLGVGLFVLQQPTSSSSETPSSRSNTSASGEASKAGDSELQALARSLSEHSDLDNHAWSTRDRVAVFRFGPRRASEAACRTWPTPLEEESVDDRAHRELLGALDRRVDHAPWNCLLRRFLEGDVDESLGIRSEIASFWSKMRVFRAPSSIASSIAARYRTASGERPSSDAFDRWLRLCGLNFEAPEGEACRRLLASLSPDQGEDLLGTVETHLRRVDPLNPSYDLRYLTDGLAHLAGFGQPDDWRIASTDALPDYDADLRLGAVLYLCRFLHSPHGGTTDRAARALSRAAGISVRAVHNKFRKRWRLACRKAFRTDGTSERPKAPLVEGVWSKGEADTDASPRYALKHAIDAGRCRVDADKPFWYCASRRWNGHRADKLKDFFFETEYLKWEGEDDFWSPN